MTKNLGLYFILVLLWANQQLISLIIIYIFKFYVNNHNDLRE